MSFATLVGPLLNRYGQRVIVAKRGGDFDTIQAAIDSISDASSEKRYLVEVKPGRYVEQVTMKEWVDIRGSGKHCTQIEFTGNDDGTVILADWCQIEDVLVELSEEASEWAIVGNDVSHFHIRNVDVLSRSVGHVSNGIKIVGGAWATGFIEHCVINYRGTTGHGILIQGNATTPQMADCHMNDVFVDSLNATTGGAIEVIDCRDVYLTNSLCRTNPAQAGTFAFKTTRTSAATVYARVNQSSLEGTNANALVVGTATTVYWYSGAYESLSQSGTLTVFPARSAFGVRAFNSGALTIPNTTLTTLTFNSERFDDAAFHSTASNTSRLTVPAGYGGWYYITGTLDWAANGTGVRGAVIQLNGATWIAATNKLPRTDGAVTREVLSALYFLSAGDYVEFLVNQTSGSDLNINVTGNSSPEFAMVRVG